MSKYKKREEAREYVPYVGFVYFHNGRLVTKAEWKRLQGVKR